MNGASEDRVATAIAHDSAIARALVSSAATVARAWETSAVRRWCQPVHASFSALSVADRRRYACVTLGAAVVTRLLLMFV